MTNSNNRKGFLSIAGDASHVLLTLSGGLTECCPVQLDRSEPFDKDQVLQLFWGHQGRCATIITGKNIDEGHWVGEAFHCNNCYGEPVMLEFLKMTVLSPKTETPAAIEDALVRVLAVAADNPELNEVKGFVGRLSAAVAQGPDAVMEFMFPASYNALRTLHTLIQQSAEDEGYDWETLTPALEAISESLTSGYGTQLSNHGREENEDLELIPWTAEVLDFLKDYINRTDNLEAEAELAWRLLTMSVQLQTRTQLDTFLETLRARLLNDDDDLRNLSSMPLADILGQITKPVAA
ncbi:hypothetical protein [Pseudomonas psychrophila]|uniref:Uncharacterized protein n=1 Tax=Pseudomonas psychrophila TaxID=122355 RepID=A0A8I1FWF8_9PSED|nr:hypothetical protein [Pseudomonas psychrophila]AVX93403.1 hypothetical protein PkP19E3_35540 [Pseudomonas koreensis]MBJ2259482.1 hypothetical protein [Pseudomonas psychrophila]